MPDKNMTVKAVFKLKQVEEPESPTPDVPTLDEPIKVESPEDLSSVVEAINSIKEDSSSKETLGEIYAVCYNKKDGAYLLSGSVNETRGVISKKITKRGVIYYAG